MWVPVDPEYDGILVEPEETPRWGEVKAVNRVVLQKTETPHACYLCGYGCQTAQVKPDYRIPMCPDCGARLQRAQELNQGRYNELSVF